MCITPMMLDAVNYMWREKSAIFFINIYRARIRNGIKPHPGGVAALCVPDRRVAPPGVMPLNPFADNGTRAGRGSRNSQR